MTAVIVTAVMEMVVILTVVIVTVVKSESPENACFLLELKKQFFLGLQILLILRGAPEFKKIQSPQSPLKNFFPVEPPSKSQVPSSFLGVGRCLVHYSVNHATGGCRHFHILQAHLKGNQCKRLVSGNFNAYNAIS